VEKDMTSIRFGRIAVFIALAGLPGVPALGHEQETFFEFPLSVNGMTVEEFVADEASALEILNTLEGIDLSTADSRDNLIQLLQRTDQGFVSQEEVPAAMHGLGGIGTSLVLRAILLKEAHRAQGRIRDYVYVDQDKSGHLGVDVIIQYFASAQDRDAGAAPIRTELLHWDIDVDGAYVVHERTGPRENPFPQVTLTLPEHAIASIWDPTRDLKYKLHARGTDIIVRHVYRKAEGGAIELLPSTDYRYTSTADSCIDLLFNPYPPEFELPPQKGYCLGRCEHPFIVNTGG
jgi:hypothetical protein